MTPYKGKMARDTALYMLAKTIEGIAGIAAIFALTHIFGKGEQYDLYVIVNIATTTLAMLAIQWLSQSASRYLNDWEVNDKRMEFYSTVFYAWVRVNVVFVIAALVARLLFIGIGNGLYALSVIFFITYNTSQLLISLLSVKRKAVTNLFISVCSSVGKLLLIYIFSIVIGAKVEIVFLSYILCDFAVIIVGFISLGAYEYIKINEKSTALLKSFGYYGLPLVGNLLTTTVLNNSDRFIIKYYLPSGELSIYSASYSIVSAAFTMLIAALMRGSYPTILKTHAKGDKELTEKLVAEAVRNYLLLAVPAAIGLGSIAKPLAELILEKSFVSGYTVMTWVAFGMLFLGLAEYSNKPWELSSKTGYIFKYSLIGGAVNIILNIVFMPYFGYMTAAYSTFIGFFIYFCLSKFNSVKIMKWNLAPKTYIAIVGSAFTMGVFIHFLKVAFENSKAMLFVYVVAGMLVYGVSLAITGEITNEIKSTVQFIKSGRRK